LKHGREIEDLKRTAFKKKSGDKMHESLTAQIDWCRDQISRNAQVNEDTDYYLQHVLPINT
jgi:hypothetical protein